MDATEIAFYGSASGLIPILLIAMAFQMTLETWWENEEPIYRAYFPFYVGAVGFFMFAAELTALGVLAAGDDFFAAKAIVLVGALFPFLHLVLAVIFRAAELHESFSWSSAFDEWEARAQRKRGAQDKRAAERAAMRIRSQELRRTMGRWELFKLGLRGVPPPTPAWLRRRRARKQPTPPTDNQG